MTEAELTAQLCLDIQRGWNAQNWLVLQRQARIAKATQMLDKCHIDGIGQHEMSIDPYIYHSWGQKLGYKCWKDKNFRREIMRDNPETRVNTKSVKTTVGYGN